MAVRTGNLRRPTRPPSLAAGGGEIRQPANVAPPPGILSGVDIHLSLDQVDPPTSSRAWPQEQRRLGFWSDTVR